MYEEQTEELIRHRMLDKVTSNVTKDEGSLIYDGVAPAAYEFSLEYRELNSILTRAFAQTSYGEWLDLKASEFGLTRKQGSYSTGTITFTGSNGTLIPANTAVQTQDGLRFLTQVAVTIASGTATVNVQAESIGSDYNIAINSISGLVVSINGVNSSSNSIAMTGGSGIESDSDLLARIIVKAKTPPGSGNVGDYQTWAMSVDGIGGVKVFPLWNGPGTVKVIVIDSNSQPANATLVSAVQANTEANRPVGSTVTYVSASPLNINIAIKVVRDTSYSLSQVQANIQAVAAQYLRDIAFSQNYVSLGKLGSLIIDNADGVLDYTMMTLNGMSSNVTIATTEVAILGSVIVSE